MWGRGKKKTQTIKTKTKVCHQILLQANGESSGKSFSCLCVCACACECAVNLATMIQWPTTHWIQRHRWPQRLLSECVTKQAENVVWFLCQRLKRRWSTLACGVTGTGGRCFHSDIGMNGSDTVLPLCAAFGYRDREWGPVDPRAGRQARRVKEREWTWVPAYVTHQQRRERLWSRLRFVFWRLQRAIYPKSYVLWELWILRLWRWHDGAIHAFLDRQPKIGTKASWRSQCLTPSIMQEP